MSKKEDKDPDAVFPLYKEPVPGIHRLYNPNRGSKHMINQNFVSTKKRNGDRQAIFMRLYSLLVACPIQ